MSGKHTVSLNITGIIACIITLIHTLYNIDDLKSKDFVLPVFVLVIDAFIVYETTKPGETNGIQIINTIIGTLILAFMLLLFFIVYSFGDWSGGFTY